MQSREHNQEIPEADRVEAVRQILMRLYALTDAGFAANRIARVEREAIFFIYEGVDKYAERKPHSAAARELRRVTNGKFPRQSITYDHAIPLRTLRGGLRAATSSLEEMTQFLRRFVQGVVITRDEDGRLNKSGLRFKLPRGAECHDMLARYRHAGIEFEPNDESLLRANST